MPGILDTTAVSHQRWVSTCKTHKVRNHQCVKIAAGDSIRNTGPSRSSHAYGVTTQESIPIDKTCLIAAPCVRDVESLCSLPPTHA